MMQRPATEVGRYGQFAPLAESEDEETGETDDVTLTRRLVKKNKKLLIAKNKRLTTVLNMIDEAVKCLVTNPPKLTPRPLDPRAADRDDFDCSLCFR